MCEGPKYKISHVTIQMEDANDLESTTASDKSFDKIEIGKKFSFKLLDEMFSS